jgi:hypothetical protein
VASDEILNRIDEHMARGNELMQEIRRQHELNRREHELNRAAFARNSEILARLVDVIGQMSRRLEDQEGAIRAQTEAIFKVLDRFGDGGGADPASA